MKTLIAVDDDRASKDAVDFARGLLADDDEAIVLNVAHLEVMPAMAMSSFGAGAYADASYMDALPTEEEEQQADTTARSIVHDASSELRHAEERVERGDVVARICAVAAEEEVDLIVLGTHDRGLWGRLWFGSVSDRVVHEAPCSVLVVR